MAMDDISRNLALSCGRKTNNDSAANTCCRLPGAKFFSSKFWRTNGRNSSRGSYTWDKSRVGAQGGLIVNPLAENPQIGGNPEILQQV